MSVEQDKTTTAGCKPPLLMRLAPGYFRNRYRFQTAAAASLTAGMVGGLIALALSGPVWAGFGGAYLLAAGVCAAAHAANP